MRTHSTTPANETMLFLGDGWSNPLKVGLRDRLRESIEELIEEELAAALGRGHYKRRPDGATEGVDASDAAPLSGHRHGHRERQLVGSFGPVEITVPRARITADVVRLASRLGEGVKAGVDQNRLQPIVKNMPRRTRHLPPRHHQISLPIRLSSQRRADQPANHYGRRESEPADFVNGLL